MNYLNQDKPNDLKVSILPANFQPPSLQTEVTTPAARRKICLTLFRVIFEAGLIYGAFMASFFLRFDWVNFDNTLLRPGEFDDYLITGIFFSFITIGLFGLHKNFLPSYRTSLTRISFLIAGAVLSSIALITLWQLLDQSSTFFSRLMFIYLAPVTWLILNSKYILTFHAVRLFRNHGRSQGAFIKKVTSSSAETLTNQGKQPSSLTLHFKRGLDIVVATLFILVFFIPIVFIALFIKLDSRGPVIFKQIRVGKNGKTFTFYKFRSMYMDADERISQLLEFNETNGATFKMKNDPRVTRVGRILRRTSMDEIPQMLNILLGHMSLVGPRPGLLREVAHYEQWQLRRLEVMPGLTGLWQVSGRSSLGFEEMTKLDIYYMDNYSLFFDIKILAYTVITVLTGKGAY